MAADINVTMHGQEVVDALSRASAGLHGAILEQLGIVSEAVAKVMREKAPVGVGGDKGLRGSIGFKVDPATLTSEIKPSVSYADAVETGSKPHFPPVSALQAWADMHGINVWALAYSISKKGTQPHPYIKPTYDETAPVIPAVFHEGIGGYLMGAMA